MLIPLSRIVTQKSNTFAQNRQEAQHKCVVVTLKESPSGLLTSERSSGGAVT